MSMTSLQFLTILSLLSVLDATYPSSRSYYGSNGYGYGGKLRRSVLQWSPYRPTIRTQRSPINYYSAYPYIQSYLDDYHQYYPQSTYPIYYPRTDKYDLYQEILPSYYKKPISDVSGPYDGYYYDIDPAELQEQMIQEVEREEREDSQPIGHEMLFENEDYTRNINNYDKANLAYFQKMLAQSHKNSLSKEKESQLNNDYSYDYDSEWQETPATKLPPYQSIDDKDVQDLRKLKDESSRANKKVNDYYENNYFPHENFKRSNGAIDDISNYITSSVPKTQLKPKEFKEVKPTTKTTTTVQSIDLEPKKNTRGQKEEVMMRPATPVRHPFSGAMINMIANDEERKRSPSVFDTLKRMLEMEKSLKNKYRDESLRPVMRKRIISDEDSLARQLTVLKKSH